MAFGKPTLMSRVIVHGFNCRVVHFMTRVGDERVNVACILILMLSMHHAAAIISKPPAMSWLGGRKKQIA